MSIVVTMPRTAPLSTMTTRCTRRASMNRASCSTGASSRAQSAAGVMTSATRARPGSSVTVVNATRPPSW